MARRCECTFNLSKTAEGDQREFHPFLPARVTSGRSFNIRVAFLLRVAGVRADMTSATPQREREYRTGTQVLASREHEAPL
jgi:hypothetical protein